MKKRFENRKVTLLIVIIITIIITNLKSVTAQNMNYDFYQYDLDFNSIGNSSTQSFVAKTISPANIYYTGASSGGSNVKGNGYEIGFIFCFNGIKYDRFGISANGWISLGQNYLQSFSQSPVNMENGNPILPIATNYGSSVEITQRNRISPLSGNFTNKINQSAEFNNTQIHYKRQGSAPYRQLVVEFENYYTLGGDRISFQIILHETLHNTNNVIGFSYGNYKSGDNNQLTYPFQIGLKGATTSDFLVRADGPQLSNTNATLQFEKTIQGMTNGSTVKINSTSRPNDGYAFVYYPRTYAPLTITKQPTSTGVCLGGTVTLTVEATGSPNLAYQWTKNGVMIINNASARTASYTISSFSAADIADYRVIVYGSCANTTSNIARLENNVLLNSSTNTTAQSICPQSSITNIVYAFSSPLVASGLPQGLTGAYNATTGLYTISGVVTASGVSQVYTYTISANNCSDKFANGTIEVKPSATISLLSAPSTESQTICFNTSIVPVKYQVTNGAFSINGLPQGLSYVELDGELRISGTPVDSGTFNYTVSATGCPSGAYKRDNNLNVKPKTSIKLLSSAYSIDQYPTIDNSISNIVYGVTNYSSLNFAGFPDGINVSNSYGNLLTISGKPSQTGTFNFVIMEEGPCVDDPRGYNEVYGKITVVNYSGYRISSISSSETTSNELLSDNISIAPNPFTNQFRVALGNTMEGPVDVKVSNTDGKILFEASQVTTPELEVSMDSFPTGIYVVEISQGKFKTYKKVVKQ